MGIQPRQHMEASSGKRCLYSPAIGGGNALHLEYAIEQVGLLQSQYQPHIKGNRRGQGTCVELGLELGLR